MANELIIKDAADLTVYFVAINPAGSVWQTTSSTFVTIVDANWANYDVAMTEQGTSSGIYVGSFPSGITTLGTYTILAYSQTGGTPAVTDAVIGGGEIIWNGTSAVSLTEIAAIKTIVQSQQ